MKNASKEIAELIDLLEEDVREGAFNNNVAGIWERLRIIQAKAKEDRQ